MTTMQTNKSNIRTSPRNRIRKPNDTTRLLWNAILAVAAEYDHMSVRQLFYQLVSRGAIDKSEHAYKRVSDASVQMRLSGCLPYGKIVDGHRIRHRPYVVGGIRQALENAHELYRRNYWINQPRQVEVWTEKDALAGIIRPICDEYQVPFLATRGFPSVTVIHDSARYMLSSTKPTTVFYFGDHDASGHSISDGLEPALRSHGVDVTVERIALHPAQIRNFQLPTRPGKTSDSRHKAFTAAYGSESVELDALPPDVLASLVERSIKRMIAWDEWERAMEIEERERQTMESISLINFEPGDRYALNGDQT